MSMRPIKRHSRARPTVEGAGVQLHRAFGFGDPAEFDPFLLFDDFRSDRPADYMAGFPWHPHRGIETITYVLAGEVEHGDSLGNRDSIRAGDVQWMTAGRGIVHQEMPRGNTAGQMHGFQLWANLPSAQKMVAPRYQGIKSAEIPEIIDDDGTMARVICGDFMGKAGPVGGVAADATYVDISVPPLLEKKLRIEVSRHAFAYVFAGSGRFQHASDPRPVPTEDLRTEKITLSTDFGNRSLILFDRGDEITVRAGEQGIRFLLITGKPLQEPVAWHGPIVMNTQSELQTAFAQLQDGTFLNPPGHPGSAAPRK